jgi:hypothetical protein
MKTNAMKTLLKSSSAKVVDAPTRDPLNPRLCLLVAEDGAVSRPRNAGLREGVLC